MLRFFISWETANCSYVVLSFIKRTQTRKRHLFPAMWTRQPASKTNYCTLFELAFVQTHSPISSIGLFKVLLLKEIERQESGVGPNMLVKRNCLV